MAKFSAKMMGKETGNASVYAEPHGMANTPIGYKTDPNSMSAIEATPGGMPARRVSGGNPDRDGVKSSGLVTRGNGCAIKGKTARGPMA